MRSGAEPTGASFAGSPAPAPPAPPSRERRPPLRSATGAFPAMSVMRVLSLVAGIVLVVTALASTTGRRADAGAARDRQLESTADLLVEQLDATVGRAAAALGVATVDTPIERIADAAGLPVCSVVDGHRACTTDVAGLVPLASFDAVLDAAGAERGPVAAVVPGTLHLAVAIDQGERQLVVAADLATEGLSPDATVAIVPVADEPLLSARTVADRRVFATPSTVEFEGRAARGAGHRTVGRPPHRRRALVVRRAARDRCAARAGRPRRDGRRAPLAAASGDDRRARPGCRTATSSHGGRRRCSRASLGSGPRHACS